MTAALCVLAAGNVWAQQAAVKPAAADAPQQEAATAAGGLPWKPLEWSQQDIEAAQARCTVLLKGLDVAVVPATPWREGTECGTPAPMQLDGDPVGMGTEFTAQVHHGVLLVRAPVAPAAPD